MRICPVHKAVLIYEERASFRLRCPHKRCPHVEYTTAVNPLVAAEKKPAVTAPEQR